jgi:hypothetical protein
MDRTSAAMLPKGRRLRSCCPPADWLPPLLVPLLRPLLFVSRACSVNVAVDRLQLLGAEAAAVALTIATAVPAVAWQGRVRLRLLQRSVSGRLSCRGCQQGTPGGPAEHREP